MAETRIPTIGITMGDPAGIGPEIVCRSLTEPAVYDVCRPVVIGSRAALERAAAAIGSHQRIQAVNDPADAVCSTQVVNVIDLPLDYDFQPGVMDVGNGRARDARGLAARLRRGGCARHPGARPVVGLVVASGAHRLHRPALHPDIREEPVAGVNRIRGGT